ncbi:MAG: aminoacyl-tRNA hydrolase [Candidatus Caldatribacteriota bacterium]|mgnify:CR=1 FL=1|nr:aminoacyl-tRNA hydrolase [Atribacterota bacterium]MDD3031317.1 aminoacyl-tRNA hydrolase [Atribacterota bacterium]MDD3640941.1 aminoacyl-tRNA hydrolase [Atribacterota bacterium]MDD4288341.1 aminoacyl-tRNA hydrolase [Atribacterota bacterium]MDD4764572.1 aminoacyl-tRNA hydrolase [Atribacterota bacterium]
MDLIVGLGNPGKQYEYSRHNIGFRILEAFIVKKISLELKWKKGFFSQYLEQYFNSKKIIFSKPQTYMNLSGRSVEKIVSYYGITPEKLLIVYDDIHLSLGNIRIRKKGSSGGHRGVESIIQSLKTEEFPRLRIGIKNELLMKHLDQPSFVLSRFLPEEEEILKNVINRSVQALEDILNNGCDYAMSIYNRSEGSTSDQD